MTGRVLVAGVGNLFLGDDAFGVELVRLLGPGNERVDVLDFGVRGHDLAFRLVSGYAGALLVDAVRRGRPPGTLCVLEPDPDSSPPDLASHCLDPRQALRWARQLGTLPPLLVVGCEPARCDQPGLSPPVQAALEPAVALVRRVLWDRWECRIGE
ncbi:MAG: hydrogenase maturation protease [Candidatus Eremiobacterota bacterium]